MNNGDALLVLVVLLTMFGTVCLIRGLARVVDKDKVYVPVAEPMPDYVIWARCDTKHDGITEWKPVLASNDLHTAWTKARLEYPLETYDLLPLPKEHTPEGQLP